MAPKQISTSSHYMTVEEFKEWLKQFDLNNDGFLSHKELRQALRSRGVGGFTTFMSIHRADKNHNGVIDDNEVENLIMFAQKKLSIRVWS